MTLETWILVLAVFAAVALTRIGRHRYTRRQRLLTVAVVAVLVAKYVRGMPTSGNDGLLEAACAAVGVLFGIGMLLSTSVESDKQNGEPWVKAGLAYLALWVVMLGSRIVFAYSATGWARSGIANFFTSNRISFSAITPAFVLMTIGSLVVVTLGIAVKVSVLRGAGESSAMNSASQGTNRPRSEGDRPLFPGRERRLHLRLFN